MATKGIRKTASAAKKAPRARKAAVKPLDRKEQEQRIRVAAYYKFVKRGRRHGGNLGDWYEAEKEILSQR